MMASDQGSLALRDTRRWVERVVIGLELCPFAAEPLRDGRVRFAASAASSAEDLANDLAEELARIDRTPTRELETTLLVHPDALSDFDDFNAFLDVGDLLLEKLGLLGEIQIVGFHPAYRFAGADPDDPANATNRSPHAMLHLLREESIARATRLHPDPDGIPARNVARLRALDALGRVQVEKLESPSSPERS